MPAQPSRENSAWRVTEVSIPIPYFRYQRFSGPRQPPGCIVTRIIVNEKPRGAEVRRPAAGNRYSSCISCQHLRKVLGKQNARSHFVDGIMCALRVGESHDVKNGLGTTRGWHGCKHVHNKQSGLPDSFEEAGGAVALKVRTPPGCPKVQWAVCVAQRQQAILPHPYLTAVFSG